MKYKIKEIRPDIFAVLVKDDYERAMLFCRVQEFYESPGSSFRDKKFSIWDYYRWYSKEGSGSFSYPRDFVGFNLPLVVAKKCYEMNELETPYDIEMKNIVDGLYKSGRRSYLIGVDSLKNSTFRHELAHAFYYSNLEYKSEMDDLTRNLSKFNISRFKKNLKAMGYCPGVVKDEIQAYMSTEVNKRMTRGIKNKKFLHQKYKSVLKRYF
ncbi:hypothetical protein EBT16_02040 [bacterium]|nr:hypothetical protein [bacterium]